MTTYFAKITFLLSVFPLLICACCKREELGIFDTCWNHFQGDASALLSGMPANQDGHRVWVQASLGKVTAQVRPWAGCTWHGQRRRGKNGSRSASGGHGAHHRRRVPNQDHLGNRNSGNRPSGFVFQTAAFWAIFAQNAVQQSNHSERSDWTGFTKAARMAW